MSPASPCVPARFTGQEIGKGAPLVTDSTNTRPSPPACQAWGGAGPRPRGSAVPPCCPGSTRPRLRARPVLVPSARGPSPVRTAQAPARSTCGPCAFADVGPSQGTTSESAIFRRQFPVASQTRPVRTFPYRPKDFPRPAKARTTLCPARAQLTKGLRSAASLGLRSGIRLQICTPTVCRVPAMAPRRLTITRGRPWWVLGRDRCPHLPPGLWAASPHRW